MAFTNKIRVLIKTADVENAGTNGKVYIGVAGREYHLDTDPHDNFEQDSLDLFIIGMDSNLSREDYQITDEGITYMSSFPVYVRLEPSGGNADWAVEFVAVESMGTQGWGHDMRNHDGDIAYSWLGREHGLYIYLREDVSYITFFDNVDYPPTNL